MRGINKVILVGTLGADPIQKTFENGTSYAQFSIATSESWKDKQGNWQESTEWHRIVVYSKLSEIVMKHLKKGKKVYIEGSLHTRSWTDKNRVTHYQTEVRVQAFQMLDTTPQANPY